MALTGEQINDVLGLGAEMNGVDLTDEDQGIWSYGSRYNPPEMGIEEKDPHYAFPTETVQKEAMWFPLSGQYQKDIEGFISDHVSISTPSVVMVLNSESGTITAESKFMIESFVIINRGCYVFMGLVVWPMTKKPDEDGNEVKVMDARTAEVVEERKRILAERNKAISAEHKRAISEIHKHETRLKNNGLRLNGVFIEIPEQKAVGIKLWGSIDYLTKRGYVGWVRKE